MPRATPEARRLLAALEGAPPKLDIDGHAVKLTTLHRVYWPEAPEFGQPAITKLDLVRHLVRLSPLILPQVRDRPLTLFRWPGGIQGRRMLQKHPETALPDFVETARIFSESKSTDDEYLLCNNLATLVWLADHGALEIHVWHSRVRGDHDPAAARSRGAGSATRLADSPVNFPDYMLFDIDPYLYSGRERSGGEPEPHAQGFAQAKQVALWLKDVLDRMSLRSCVKTSGKTGLHVAVPIEPRLRYDVVRAIARTICEHLLSLHPASITTQWDTGKREGKVFMDFNMNVRGKSIIAPWCPRGLAGAPVSMPLSWRQLSRAVPTAFRVGTLDKAAPTTDPWSAAFEDRQDLEAAVARLAAGEPTGRG